jgi:hypothetical protein
VTIARAFYHALRFTGHDPCLTNPLSSETRIIGVDRWGLNKKDGTGVTPSLSARGRAAPGLELTSIRKSGKGIAELQNGTNLTGTFEKLSILFDKTVMPPWPPGNRSVSVCGTLKTRTAE